MRRMIRIIYVAIVAAIAAPVAASGPPIAIRDVTLIDVTETTEALAKRSGQAVLIEDGHIAWVGADRDLSLPSGATIVNGKGKFVIPAFWDMHVHIAGPETQQRATLLLLLAHGITNVRDMGNSADMAEFRQLRKELESSLGAGPRIIASPMRITDGWLAFDPDDAAGDKRGSVFFPRTDKEVVDLVTYVAQQGYDFIKPYDRLSRQAFLTLMKEARGHKIPVAGHLPGAVSVREAAAAGLKSLEHARSLAWHCAPEGAVLQQAYDAGTKGIGPPPDGSKLQNNPELLRAVIAGFDSALCQQSLAAMKRSGMAYVPTHMTRRMDAFASLPEIRTHPQLRYIDPEVQAGWNEDADFYADRPVEERAAFMAFYAHGLMLTRLAHAAGVTVLVGTDTPDTYVFPGSSFHQEMQELVDAGLTPFEVLKSATIKAAAYSGLERERGSIEKGKVADLLLLDADPIGDIANSQSISLVMKGGAMLDRSRLEGLRAEAAAVVNSVPNGAHAH